MPLHQRAVLEIDAFNRTGVFEFRTDLDPTRELTHNHLVGGRGQILSELYRQVADRDPSDILPDDLTDRRAGFYVDAGAGMNKVTLSASVGRSDDDLRWGDGSSTGDSATAYDAEGAVSKFTKRAVLFRWLTARADSGGQMRLYTGEWSDGTHADSAGVYGEPIPVALQSVRAPAPADEPDISYTIELVKVSTVADIDEAVDDFTEAATEAVETVGDAIEDY